MKMRAGRLGPADTSRIRAETPNSSIRRISTTWTPRASSNCRSGLSSERAPMIEMLRGSMCGARAPRRSRRNPSPPLSSARDMPCSCRGEVCGVLKSAWHRARQHAAGACAPRRPAPRRRSTPWTCCDRRRETPANGHPASPDSSIRWTCAQARPPHPHGRGRLARGRLARRVGLAAERSPQSSSVKPSSFSVSASRAARRPKGPRRARAGSHLHRSQGPSGKDALATRRHIAPPGSFASLWGSAASRSSLRRLAIARTQRGAATIELTGPKSARRPSR